MSLRFRRSFKIAPGIRLNVGKTGLSVSAGVRGARVTVGSRGVTGTVGLPGTGLSYTTKLSGTPDTRSGPSKKALREARYEANSSEVRNEESAYRVFTNIASYAPPLTSSSEWQQQLVQKPFSLAEYGLKLPTFEAILSTTEWQSIKQQALQWDFISYSVTLLFLIGACVVYAIKKEQIPAILAGSISIGLLAICFRTLQRAKKTGLPLAEERIKAIQRDVDEARNQHVRKEEDRIRDARRLFDGNPEHLEFRLAEIGPVVARVLANGGHPIEIDLGFEICSAHSIYVDLDLPEIEVVTKQTTKRVLKSGEVREREKSSKLINQEYAEGAVGIGFYVATYVFNISPSLEEVVISGYTQRVDSSTGNLKDDYVYSVKFERRVFSSLNLKTIAPLEGIKNFPYRIGLGRQFELRTIEPFQPEKKS